MTQRFILQPRLEMNLFSKRDVQLRNGTGLTDFTAGLRLRYEVIREFAPYIGVEWAESFGATANLMRASAQDTQEIRIVAGMRWWF